MESEINKTKRLPAINRLLPFVGLVVCALLSIGIVLKYGFTPTALRFILLTCLMAVTSIIDIRYRTVPAWVIIATGILSLMRIFEGTGLPELILGCLVAAAVYIVVLISESAKGRKLMGRGDIKLLFVLGLHYEIVEMLYIVLISCIITLAAILLFYRDKKRGIALCPMFLIGVCIITLVR